MEIHALVRGRFVLAEGATATPVADNAWMVRVPRTERMSKALRCKVNLEALDGMVFLIDAEQSEPAVGAAETREFVELTALVL